MSGASNAASSAGAQLRAGREALGLSVDAVAQQLKLSPRQVHALEVGDFSLLPGRTFVRGFVRNYARLVRLDAEHVLGALPSGSETPTLEAPTLHPTAPAMGELPTTDATRAPWTRWAIPASLAAVVAVAAVYEWARPAAASRSHPVSKEANVATEAPPTPPAAERVETLLSNPLAVGASAPSATKEDATLPAAAQPITPSSPEPVETKGAAGAR
jgi:cytoskeleton protein RodZ